jgi:hypothetical protein
MIDWKWSWSIRSGRYGADTVGPQWANIEIGRCLWHVDVNELLTNVNCLGNSAKKISHSAELKHNQFSVFPTGLPARFYRVFVVFVEFSVLPTPSEHLTQVRCFTDRPSHRASLFNIPRSLIVSFISMGWDYVSELRPPTEFFCNLFYNAFSVTRLAASIIGR